MSRRSTLIALALSVALAACGGGETTGPTVADPRGSWSGTYGTAGGSSGTLAMVVTDRAGGDAIIDGERQPFSVSDMYAGHFVWSRGLLTDPPGPAYVTSIHCDLTDARTCEGFLLRTEGRFPIRLTR